MGVSRGGARVCAFFSLYGGLFHRVEGIFTGHFLPLGGLFGVAFYFRLADGPN